MEIITKDSGEFAKFVTIGNDRIDIRITRHAFNSYLRNCKRVDLGIDVDKKTIYILRNDEGQYKVSDKIRGSCTVCGRKLIVNYVPNISTKRYKITPVEKGISFVYEEEENEK